ncbi:hypothetical protein [Paenibacillus gansuensis]|uniref:Uncharacterized protein n=1 Tax=Paenibacillus gansuensis TaxID=306542 RepID=A0ABW5PB05_9BACL
MKLRLLPIAITVILSAGLLFGGWFIYQSVAVENPLTAVVDSTPGVEKAQTSFGDDSIDIQLQLKADANAREVYQHIAREGASIIGGRELKLNVTNKTSPVLEKIWSQGLFQVAEAMETKHYADIPAALEKLAKAHSGLKVSTEMDEDNVYIRLSEGSTSKFVILPRIPAQMGVWTP